MQITQRSKGLKITTIDIFMLLFLAYQMVVYTINGNLYGTSSAYLPPLAGCLYFFLRNILLMRKARYIILIILIGWCSIEIILCIGQILQITDFALYSFSFGGSFGNPGAVGGFFSLLLPMFLSVSHVLSRCRACSIVYNWLIICLILMIFLVIMSDSRGAWIASIVGCSFVCIKRYKNKLLFFYGSITHKITCCVCFLLICCSTIVFLYLYKADSAFGRLFIWKVAIKMSHTNFLFGEGISTFYAKYSGWQSDYFKIFGGTDKEKYVADYVTTAYNEFLEKFIEQGVMGMTFLVVFFVLTLATSKHYKRCIMTGARGAIWGLLILCLVSYPLTIPTIMILVVLYVALISISTFPLNTISSRWIKSSVISFVFVSFFFVLSELAFFAYGKYTFTKGQIMMSQGKLDDAMELYRKASIYLKNDGILMFQEGVIFSMKKDYYKALMCYQSAMEKTSDPNLFLQIGDCYKEMGNMSEANNFYKKSSCVIPSRLYPRYKQFQLSKQINNKEESMRLAYEILSIPVKIPTIYAENIREEMQDYIKKSNQKKVPME